MTHSESGAYVIASAPVYRDSFVLPGNYPIDISSIAFSTDASSNLGVVAYTPAHRNASVVQNQTRTLMPVLLSYGGFQVLKPVGRWCHQDVSFSVLSQHRSNFTVKNTVLQKLLGGIRAILAAECPAVKRIHLVGQAHGIKVYSGSASAADNWLLKSSLSSTRTRTHMRPWIESLLALMLLGFAVLTFRTLGKRNSRTQSAKTLANRTPSQGTYQTQVAQPNERIVQGEPILCPSCGSEIRAGVKFCATCGVNTTDSIRDTKGTCPSCHTANSLQAKFCRKCGKRMQVQ